MLIANLQIVIFPIEIKLLSPATKKAIPVVRIRDYIHTNYGNLLFVLYCTAKLLPAAEESCQNGRTCQSKQSLAGRGRKHIANGTQYATRHGFAAAYGLTDTLNIRPNALLAFCHILLQAHPLGLHIVQCAQTAEIKHGRPPFPVVPPRFVGPQPRPD